MITLNLLKSNKNSGAIKKMLHVPTLAIFAVKEQPITSKEIRKSLRDWLHFWPSSLNSNEQFVRVYGTWWNVPEGCVSIIMEHMNGGSLHVCSYFSRISAIYQIPPFSILCKSFINIYL